MHDVVKRIIEELQSSSYPLYLYGKGTSTSRIADFLLLNQVPVYGVLVNREYYNAGQKIKGLSVGCFEDFLLHNECELLICTGDWVETSFADTYKKNIKKIHAYDFWGLFAIEEWNLWDDEFINKNKNYLTWLRNSLSDAKSKCVFDEIVKQRTTLCYSRNFDPPVEQYFDDEIILLNDSEVFVDCGAYHGENLIELKKRLKKDGKNLGCAIEFEVDNKNVSILSKQVFGIKGVKVVAKGVWDSRGSIYLCNSDEKSSKVSETKGIPISVTTIDHECYDLPVTFIKMDIEGAELRALKGAERTIKRYRPKLAISVYHRPSDFIEIPKYIDSLNMDYRFYLRCYSQTGCETILYAV